MIKARFFLAFFCLALVLPLRAFDWETATVEGRDYVTLQSFCKFYSFPYEAPRGNKQFFSDNGQHTLQLKSGSPEMHLDGVHYVLSFPTVDGDHDLLISKMDVIKLFEPVLRPKEISGRHVIRGVVIDPGHGGSDNGATSRLGAEKNYTLKTAFLLEAVLHKAGLKATVLTRRSDVFVDLYERANIAALYPDYAFVSIHFNSATPEARGLETYCLSPRGAASTSSAYLTRGDIQKLPGNDYDTQNILLASMVHSEIIKLNPGDPSVDRGIKRARFVVIKQNVLPAILVEGGFLSNPVEARRIDQPEYQQKLAVLIARGVIRFANSMGDTNLQLPAINTEDHAPAPALPPKPPTVTPPKPAPSPPKPVTTSPPKPTAPKTTAPPATTTKPGATSGKTKKPTVPDHPKPTPPAPTPPKPTAPKPAANPPANSLNLIEPTVPATAPNHASDEPDEPPTVNFYPAPAASTNAPPASPP